VLHPGDVPDGEVIESVPDNTLCSKNEERNRSRLKQEGRSFVGLVWYTALFGFGGYGVHIRGRDGSFLSWFVVRILKFPRNPTGHRRSHTAQQTTQRAEDNKRTNKKEICGIAGSIPAEKNDARTKNSREQTDQKPYPRPSDDTSNNYSGESGGEGALYDLLEMLIRAKYTRQRQPLPSP
jgi:hypothetical protein